MDMCEIAKLRSIKEFKNKGGYITDRWIRAAKELLILGDSNIEKFVLKNGEDVHVAFYYYLEKLKEFRPNPDQELIKFSYDNIGL